MCRRVQCEQCQKPSFAGCGKHVEQVLRGVSDADRCQCKLGHALGPVTHHGSNAQQAAVEQSAQAAA